MDADYTEVFAFIYFFLLFHESVWAYGVFLRDGCQLFQELGVKECGKHTVPGLRRDLGTWRKRFRKPPRDVPIEKAAESVIRQEIPL